MRICCHSWGAQAIDFSDTSYASLVLTLYLPTLTSVAQWFRHRPANRKVISWIPLGARAWLVSQGPSWGQAIGNPADGCFSCTLMFLFLPPLPSL